MNYSYFTYFSGGAHNMSHCLRPTAQLVHRCTACTYYLSGNNNHKPMTTMIFNKKKNYQTSITKMFGNNTIIVRRSAAKARLRVENGGVSVGVFLQYSCGTDPIDTAGTGVRIAQRYRHHRYI